MNCATSSALAPATTSTYPPIAADSSTSGGPRPCWPSCKPRDPGLASSQLRRYLLARDLTEPRDALVGMSQLCSNTEQGVTQYGGNEAGLHETFYTLGGLIMNKTL